MTMKTVNLEIEITKHDVVSGTKNYVCSQKYIERIVKVSVMNILFHRLPIPEVFFVTKEFNSIPYHSIRTERIGTGIAQLYRKWIHGFKDAFRKKYLKEFVLFFSDDMQNIEEHFKFKFEYEDNIAKDRASEDLTDLTELLLKNLMALGDMPKLPMDIQMHVELYYLQDTPKAYAPPFFDSKDYKSTLKSKMDHQVSETSTLGRINTGFHYFKFSLNRKSKDSQFLQDSEGVQKVKRRKRTITNVSDDVEEIIGTKKGKWNISDSKILQSMTSIDLASNISREGVSFDVDYEEILDDEDIDAIADAMSDKK